MYNRKVQLSETALTMDSNPSTEVLSPVPDTQFELLYATPAFQVRLWRLRAEARLQDFMGTGGQGVVHESQCLLVSGRLSVVSGDAVFMPERGQRFVLDGQSPHALQTAQQQAVMLELRRGTGLQPKPLAEITEERPWGSFTVLK